MGARARGGRSRPAVAVRSCAGAFASGYNVLMRITLRTLSLLLVLTMSLLAAPSLYDFTLDSIEGKPTSLGAYKGKALLLVNVASKCGYTPQYEGLQALSEKYADQGLVVMGFPANNFGKQEPGTDAEIKQFCSRNYNVTFPMFSKISVAGEDKAPLYQFLTDTHANPSTGGEIKWNFTKFLVDRHGKIIQRFESKVEPQSPEMAAAIEKALKN